MLACVKALQLGPPDLSTQTFHWQVPTVCTQEVVRAVPKLEAPSGMSTVFRKEAGRDWPGEPALLGA